MNVHGKFGVSSSYSPWDLGDTKCDRQTDTRVEIRNTSDRISRSYTMRAGEKPLSFTPQCNFRSNRETYIALFWNFAIASNMIGLYIILGGKSPALLLANRRLATLAETSFRNVYYKWETLLKAIAWALRSKRTESNSIL